MIKVSILEDSAVALNYFEALIAGSEGMEVVSTFRSGQEAIEGISAHVPDVFIIDLGLPDISGVDVMRALREQQIETEMLVITGHNDREHLFSAIRAGATGYLLKGTAPAVIIRAVEVAAQGASPLSPRIARFLMEEFNGINSARNGVCLSRREKDVLIGFSRGLSERGLAKELSLSPHTIHTHAKNIYKKLGVKSRVEAVLKAKKTGIA